MPYQIQNKELAGLYQRACSRLEKGGAWSAELAAELSADLERSCTKVNVKCEGIGPKETRCISSIVQSLGVCEGLRLYLVESNRPAKEELPQVLAHRIADLWGRGLACLTMAEQTLETAGRKDVADRLSALSFGTTSLIADTLALFASSGKLSSYAGLSDWHCHRGQEMEAGGN
ncbi:MAG: hypothetical protein DCC75_08830 [Proteobacteria bacterium]|nr:MAG: hypothetical protein DCC75_08830 [Pseudomonadota bacterium]